MPRNIVLAVGMFIIGACVSQALAGPLGVGIMVGEPTGLSAKLWTTRGHALDFGAAWSFADETALDVHADYLIHRPGPPEISVGGLLFYCGVGGRIKLEQDNNRVGVRIPLGVTYLFAQSHLDFFFEIAPILDLAPATGLRVNGGFGLRYYLGGRPQSSRL